MGPSRVIFPQRVQHPQETRSCRWARNPPGHLVRLPGSSGWRRQPEDPRRDRGGGRAAPGLHQPPRGLQGALAGRPQMLIIRTRWGEPGRQRGGCRFASSLQMDLTRSETLSPLRDLLISGRVYTWLLRFLELIEFSLGITSCLPPSALNGV